LVELIIGVTILILLTAIIVNAYQTFVVRQQVSHGFELASSLKPAISKHLENHGAMPASRAAAGLSPSSADTSTAR